MSRSAYTVLKDGYVAGVSHRKGDTVTLTPSQAKYEHVAPFDATPDEGAANSATAQNAATVSQKIGSDTPTAAFSGDPKARPKRRRVAQ